MSAPEIEQGGALQTAKDLFSGAVGGIVQVLVGRLYSRFIVCWGFTGMN